MAAFIPSGAPLSVKLVGAHTYFTPSTTTVNTSFEYQFPDTWLLINVAMQQKGDVRTIVGLNVVPRTQSLEEENKFTFSGKSALQYATLASGIMAAAISLYALVVCIRTKLPRRKWLWILFIISGLGKLWVNWTTGQWGLQPISVQLFSLSAFAALYGPWMISTSVPLGAIVFLVSRRKLAMQPAAVEASNNSLTD